MTGPKSVLHNDQSFAPRFALIAIVVLSLSLIALLVFQGLKPENTMSRSPDFAQAAQVYVPGQEMTVTTGNVTVYVPQNAVSIGGTVSIASREPNLFPTVGQPNWTRPQIIEVEFLDTQGTPVPGIIFSSPVAICFKLTSEQWEDFTARPDAYEVQYYAVENHPVGWQALPLTMYADVSLICGQSVHFTLFALAIRLDSIIPVTGLTMTPTSSLPGARRTPIRYGPTSDDSADVPLPTSIQPNPTHTQPPVAPTSQPPSSTLPVPTLPLPTENPPPTIEPEPTSGGGLPIPTLPVPLPTIPIGNP